MTARSSKDDSRPPEAREPMTYRESRELADHVKRLATVGKAQAVMRSAELLADFEEQLAAVYGWDQQDVWREAAKAVIEAVKAANEAIRQRSRELGIPDEFAPRMHTYWSDRGENATKERRAELRKVATTRIAALEKAAKATIEARSVATQGRLLEGRLTSAEAKAAMAELLSPADLMPALDMGEVRKQLGRGR